MQNLSKNSIVVAVVCTLIFGFAAAVISLPSGAVYAQGGTPVATITTTLTAFPTTAATSAATTAATTAATSAATTAATLAATSTTAATTAATSATAAATGTPSVLLPQTGASGSGFDGSLLLFAGVLLVLALLALGYAWSRGAQNRV